MRLQTEDKTEESDYLSIDDDGSFDVYFEEEDDDLNALDMEHEIVEEEMDSEMKDYLESKQEAQQLQQAQQERPQNKVHIDASGGKIAAVIAMFIVMFALPVFVYENYDYLKNIGKAPVYSSADTEEDKDTNATAGAPKTGQNDQGSVLGVSTSDTTKLDVKVLGLPLATILILFGLIFLLVPLYYLVK